MLIYLVSLYSRGQSQRVFAKPQTFEDIYWNMEYCGHYIHVYVSFQYDVSNDFQSSNFYISIKLILHLRLLALLFLYFSDFSYCFLCTLVFTSLVNCNQLPARKI